MLLKLVQSAMSDSLLKNSQAILAANRCGLVPSSLHDVGPTAARGSVVPGPRCEFALSREIWHVLSALPHYLKCLAPPAMGCSHRFRRQTGHRIDSRDLRLLLCEMLTTQH